MQRERTVIEITGETPADTEKRTRVAAYCRVSTDSSDQLHSFAAQVKYYTELIENHSDEVLIDIYADEGISGRSINKRKDFQRLILDCQKGKIDRIITKSVSRFARNTVDCLNTVRMLSSLGISILFEKENIDTASMSSEVLLALSGIQAQDESISHGNNMRWAFQGRMKHGEFIGCKAPYGYNLHGCHELTINEDEAKIVRRIAGMYLNGIGKQSIANILNDEGITRRNSKWNICIIDYILNNERYIGDALLQKKITTNSYPPKKVRNTGIAMQYYVENSNPAIITKEQFEAIKELQKQRNIKEIRQRGHPLSKMLYCPDCGHVFRRLKRSSIQWRCSQKNKAVSNCTSRIIEEDDVYDALICMVNKLRDSQTEIIEPLINRLEKLQSKVNGTESRIYEIDKKIADISRQSLAIAKLLANKILDPADFSGQHNILTDKINQLRLERRKVLHLTEKDNTIVRLRETSEILSDMDSDITEFDEELIRSLVERITVISATEIRIRLHGGFEICEKLPMRKRRCKTA